MPDINFPTLIALGAIVLLAILIGLGIGSSFGAMLAGSVKSPRWTLGTFQMLIAASIAWTAAIITYSLPYWPIDPSLAAGVTNQEWAPWYMFQLDFVRALFAIFPGAFLWGASFPLALASVSARGADPGRVVGRGIGPRPPAAAGKPQAGHHLSLDRRVARRCREGVPCLVDDAEI